jgi:hypothetical protein
VKRSHEHLDMAKGSKKLWYVRREVVASYLTEALRTKGRVYSVELAEEKLWPENKANVGYGNKDQKKLD